MTNKQKIVNILLEFDGDAKRGYFHEPRTEKEILDILSLEIVEAEKRGREEALKEIIKQYDNEIEENKSNDNILTAKFLFDMRSFAIDSLSHPIQGKGSYRATPRNDEVDVKHCICHCHHDCECVCDCFGTGDSQKSCVHCKD